MKTPPVSTTNNSINNFNCGSNQTDSEKLKLLKQIETLKAALSQKTALVESLQNRIEKLTEKNKESTTSSNTLTQSSSIINSYSLHILNNDLSQESKMLKDRIENSLLDPWVTLSSYGKSVPKNTDGS